jgi:hypothetical protein
VANDTSSSYDVFVRDLQMGTTTLVSVNRLEQRLAVQGGDQPGWPLRGVRAGRAICWRTTPTELLTCSWGSAEEDDGGERQPGTDWQ